MSEISGCCDAAVSVAGRTTKYYVCGNCGKPCDARDACALCGHAVTGWGFAEGHPLCHSQERDCYHRWTVYGARPGKTPWPLYKVGAER